jgi:tRNA 2-selenouridine synthase
VESESRKVGTVQLGNAQLRAMRAAACVRLRTPRPLRVQMLKEDYAHFLSDPEALCDRLSRLVELHGRKTIDQWNEAARAGDFDALVDELLVRHYDPMYLRSIEVNFPRSAQALDVDVASVSSDGMRRLASELIASVSTEEIA